MALERRVEFQAAFDRRSEGLNGPGQNCAMMHMAVGDKRGWVSAHIFTGWWLPAQFEESKRTNMVFRPFASPVTFHSPKPVGEMKHLMGYCPYFKGGCFSEGSFILGDAFWLAVVENGDPWAWLESRHVATFGPTSCAGDYSHHKVNELLGLLIEARDALPAIPLASARLRGIDLTLADRIETAIQPWAVPDGTPGAI